MADKDKQPQQADFDKAFEDVKAGKIQPPRNDDMGPLPKRTGLEFVNPKDNEQVKKSQAPARAQMLKDIKESMSGPNVPGEYKKKGGAVKKMAKGGKVSQLAKANGIAVRGKTRGKIC